jgi:hypothetical protein
MSLTKEQLAERIKQVDQDLQKIRSAGADEKKIFTLIQYKEYLQDELKLLERR